MGDLEQVNVTRARLWNAGFRPVPIHNWNAKGPSPGKRPLGENWRESALKDPPFCVTIAAVMHALNTGVLGDGLRPIDIDIDDPILAARVGALAVEWFGPAPVRTRRNSARCLLLYAAAEGQPRKIAVTGATHTKDNGCKVEALGAGQQFVAFGRHDSGAELEWTTPPGEIRLADLPTIAEPDLIAFMAEVAIIIGAEPPRYTNGHDRGHDGDHYTTAEPQADALRVCAAVAAIANTGPADWEGWNRVGMAIWAATGGGTIGGELFNEWSKRHPAYDEAATRERWRHYQRSPPTQIGAGTLFHMAGGTFHPTETTPEPPDWVNEDTQSREEQGKEQTKERHPILTARQFFDTFTVPDYLIDGIIQLGRVYALTSPTGHGKTAVALFLGCMVAAGRNIGNIETEQARVLFMAGENPDDLTARFHAACQVHGLDPDTIAIDFMPGNFPLDPEAAELLRQKIDATGHTYGLIIGDSIAAYFPGDNENDNVQMGASARNWRVLSTCRGTPAVIGLAHPVKNPDKENLLPRGGGAFIAEIDANLTLWADGERETTTMHWAGKLRGADFTPVTFALTPVKLNGKADKKGRPFMSVVAVPQSEEQAGKTRERAISDENIVLEWMRRYPDITQRDIAMNAGWTTPDGKPLSSKVNRLLKSLNATKLIKNWRGKWVLTDLGIAELKASQE